MSTQTRKRRGRDTERIVAEAMRGDGWPFAEPVGAGRSGADVTGTPGISVEVKARRGWSIGAWLRQAIAAAANGEVPVVVVRLDGQGPATVDDWPATLPFAVLRRLLRQAGYGDPLGQPPPAGKQPPDPARADTGKGHDFAEWLPTPGGRDWLACLKCERVIRRDGSLDDDTEGHALGCPNGTAVAS